MARPGESIENPVTGERIVWRQTAAGTAGALLQFDLLLQPGAAVAAAHAHPLQEERFVVRTGVVCLRVAGRTMRVGAGSTATVPRSAAHAWWNGGDQPACVTVEFRPALRTERFFETAFALARAGRCSRRGVPANPFQLAAFLNGFRRETVLPHAWQRALLGPAFALLAAIGAQLGYRSEYHLPPVSPKTTRSSLER